ncbi:MAG: sigma 54-interacting transcriptional regulator, partial [Clostridia bacterium]
MKKYELFSDAVSNPVLLTNSKGEILHKNESAKRLLTLSDLGDCKNISEISGELLPNRENESRELKIVLRSLNYSLREFCFSSHGDEAIHLFIFDDAMLCSKLVAQLLDAIDEGVTVVDETGRLETFNETAAAYIGMSRETGYENIGRDLQEALRERQLLSSALAPIVIREQKTVTKNLEYSNGKVVTYTGTPIFDDEQKLRHVVLTGRDVSRLVQLESQLNELVKIKNDYYTRLMELSMGRDAEGPVCSSKKMEYVLAISSKVAPTDAPIFLTGESGVGKEEVARFIHRKSDRRGKPFVAINCAAIPEQLMESELFGFNSGAFTGANKNGKSGLLEEANGGSFFLDEIGEMPFAVQSKLLRVVQEGKMYRIGSTTPIDLDIRYISATNLSEAELGNSTKFRRDLYYRLCVVPIHIPPLRERADDIIPLVSFFLESFNQKYKKKIKISNQAMRAMTKIEWQGNVRELKNVVERLVILSEDELVEIPQLEIALDMGGSGDREKISVAGLMPLAEAHDAIDRILISEAYARCGTIVDAAKA